MAPSGILWGVDVLKAKFFPIRSADDGIDAPGYPVAAETPYEGLEFAGPKSLTLNLGAPRAIVNVAQGRVQDTIYLPSIDAKTGEFHVSYVDLETFAELSAVKTFSVGGSKSMPFGTDKQGLEIQGIFLISRLVSHSESGGKVWDNYILPRVSAVITMPSFTDAALDVTINLSLSPTKSHIWGEALTEADHGALSMTGLDHVTADKFNIVAWVGDGSETTFLLPTDFPSASSRATTFKVYDYSTGMAVSGTPGETSFVAGGAPTDGALLIGLYEYE
jgi:hypothetical protein